MSVTRERAKEAFELFDSEHRGFVTSEEVGFILRGIGFSDLSDQELTAMIKAMDIDGSEKIPYDEYERAVLRKRAEPGSPEEIWRAFKMLDGNGTGHLTVEDIAPHMHCSPFFRGSQPPYLVSSIAEDPNIGISYDNWRLAMNNLQATTRSITKL